MLDIGLGEVALIAVLALLVFGPDRLPKVAADAARALRQVREMASAARRDLVDAAGVEQDEELSGVLSDLRELDPRRVLDPLPPPRTKPAAKSGAAAPAPASSTPAAPPAPTVPEPPPPTAVDPDWS